MEENIKFQIKQLFDETFNNEMNESEPRDYLLKGFKFFDIHRIISMRIGLFYEKLFELYGFKRDLSNNKRRADIINHDKKIIIELKNNIKSCNFDSKSSKFFTLKKIKKCNPDYEIIFGCINDFKDRDFINKDNVRILTGNKLFEHLLGEDYNIVILYIKFLMESYLNEIVNKGYLAIFKKL